MVVEPPIWRKREEESRAHGTLRVFKYLVEGEGTHVAVSQISNKKLSANHNASSAVVTYRYKVHSTYP